MTCPRWATRRLGYVFSAAVGIFIVALVIWLFAMLLTSGSGSRKSKHE